MKRNIFSLIGLLLFASVWSAPIFADAANLHIFSARDQYTRGEIFEVRVLVSSPREAINAVSGTLVFPQDMLEVVSVSGQDSVMDFWVQNPSFSNKKGTVSFAGVVLNPGFQGSAGNVLDVAFRVKKSGIARLELSSGLVLANDGKGTNVLEDY